MSLHTQVPAPATPTVPVEAVDPAGIGVWFIEYFTQPVATVLASAGIVFAALITYKVGSKNRKQLEEHHAATHTLADTQALRDRFTTITTQLADPAPAIRTAAVSALEALADDWLDRNKPRETQACINVLCDYLRTPYEPLTRNPHLRKQTRRTHRTKYDYTDTTHEYPHDDLDTRHAITRTIAAHLQPHHDHSWSTFDYDLTGAYLHNTNLTGATFTGKTASFRGATFNGEYSLFDNATFSSESHSFEGATFSSKTASFSGAKFTRSKLTSFDGVTFSSETILFNRAMFGSQNTLFRGATFISSEYCLFDDAMFGGDKTWFDGATFSGGYTSFRDAKFASHITSVVRATFNAESTSFDGPTFTGKFASFDGATFGSCEYTSFDGATFSSIQYTSFNGATFSGGTISFDGVTFSGGTISFAGATFSSKTTTFENPQAWRNVRMGWERHPDSVFGPLRPQPESVHPHKWPPVPKL